MKKSKTFLLLFLILLFAAITRFWNLSYPKTYIFDEVYHAFTAEAYAQNDPRGYEWWHTSPVKGTAYEWLHPPLSKLFMAVSILVFGNNSFGWRFASAVFGVLTIFLIYSVAKKLFNEKTGLLAALIASLDGLILVQSRIAMNDVFIAVFILTSIYWLISWFEKERPWQIILAGIFAGLAASTKWTGFYLVFPFGFVILTKFFKQKKKTSWLKKNWPYFLGAFFLVPLIYVASYVQWWLQGHTLKQFYQLHQQIWWYQTRLTATHGYGSKALTWPLMLRPVWYFVDYGKNKIANIYAQGNSLIWWSGLAALIIGLIEGIRKKNFKLQFLLVCYLAFWLPWVFSPRVMFLYHYLPSLLFLILTLAWLLWKVQGSRFKVQGFSINGKLLVAICCLLFAVCYLLFLPIYTGISIPQNYFKLLLWFPSWK